MVCLRHSRPSASYPETYQRPQGVCVGWVGESRCGMGLVTRVVWVPNRCSSSHSVTGVGEGLAGEAGGVGMWVSDGCNPACSHTSRTSGVGGGDCSLFSCSIGPSPSATSSPHSSPPVPSRVDAGLETFALDSQLGDRGAAMLPPVVETIESVGLSDLGVSWVSTAFVVCTVTSGSLCLMSRQPTCNP